MQWIKVDDKIVQDDGDFIGRIGEQKRPHHATTMVLYPTKPTTDVEHRRACEISPKNERRTSNQLHHETTKLNNFRASDENLSVSVQKMHDYVHLNGVQVDL